MASTYRCDMYVRGYHVCHSLWSVEVGENLVCKWEMSNLCDSYAVIITKGEETACRTMSGGISSESGPLGSRRWPLVGLKCRST